jgi:sigma-B regulation protein RsbU (phosphoserine phosphatase)
MSNPLLLAPTLELFRAGRLERVYEFKGADLHLGRAPGLDICLDDTRVSRHHARLEHRADGSSCIVDLDSKSSTKLNGRKLAPFQAAPLRDGSRIKIVDFELIFREHKVAVRNKAEDGATVMETIDDLSSSHLARRSPDPGEALEAILEINRALGGGADLNEMLGRALEGLMTIFPTAERGFILTAEPGRPRIRAVRHRCSPAQTPVLSRTILDHVLHQGTAVLIKDTTIDPRFKGAKSVIFNVSTAMCVPLLGHDGERLGMVQLDRSTAKRGFKARDLDLLATLAVPIGTAVENHRLLKERLSWAAAREIQLALLPRGRPEIPGYAFWECYRPSLEVGGDLYDYIAVEQSGVAGERHVPWAVTIGDVAGKGMPAALLAASICPEIRHLVRIGVVPEEVLTRVNRHISKAQVDGRFVTLALTQLDSRSHRMTVVNAGHMEPLVRRASGEIEAIVSEGEGPPLGVEPQAVYLPTTISLQPGDVVVLYTDGVTDAMDDESEPFGEERLRQTLAAAPPEAAAAGEAILAAVRNHATGPTQFDDITIICFGRL